MDIIRYCEKLVKPISQIPGGILSKQWQNMLVYFNFQCIIYSSEYTFQRGKYVLQIAVDLITETHRCHKKIYLQGPGYKFRI